MGNPMGTLNGKPYGKTMIIWKAGDLVTVIAVILMIPVELCRARDGGFPSLVSILRMAACPVSLAQSLCHCVTNERTRNLVNYTVSNVTFH